MNIINIVPGFGGTFYCGNCLRDSDYVTALKASGHEAHTLPIYLPLSMDHQAKEENVPVFYGAISIYLKQQFKIFRHMPFWLEKFFNSAPFLKLAAKKAGSTRAEGLEEMTISMLKGHEGYQAEELDMLINYLKHHAKPDIIHLSNALLLGLAKKIKQELNIPVVCSLQDEDVWIDAMRPSYVPGLWKLLSEKAADVDAFIPVSHYFSEIMQQKMNIPSSKIHVVPIGIEPELYNFKEPDTNNPSIGYLSRLNKENGFDIVIDAFIKLKKMPGHEQTRLKVTGGSTGDDKRFIHRQKRKLKRNGILKDVQFLSAYEGEKKKAFLRELTLLSVPVLKGEAFGLYQLEAMASGTPVVQPAVGAFPEIAQQTGGGLTYAPNTAEMLAQKWFDTLAQPDKVHEMAVAGRKAVEGEYNLATLIKKMIQVYTLIAVKEDVCAQSKETTPRYLNDVKT